jgi:uncharacterized membrane protein
MSWIKNIVSVLMQGLIVPLCILLAVLISSVLLVASPMVWKSMYEAPEKLPATAQADGEIIAVNLWSNTPYAEISKTLSGGKLHPREIHHYEDLQKKFTQMSVAFLLLAAVVLCALRSPRFHKMLWLSVAWLVVISIAGTAWALHDWRDFFRTLHAWIFQNDSWKLPNGCYSLQLFPYPVWKKAMLVMMIFSLVGYSLLITSSVLLKKK